MFYSNTKNACIIYDPFPNLQFKQPDENHQCFKLHETTGQLMMVTSFNMMMMIHQKILNGQKFNVFNNIILN